MAHATTVSSAFLSYPVCRALPPGLMQAKHQVPPEVHTGVVIGLRLLFLKCVLETRTQTEPMYGKLSKRLCVPQYSPFSSVHLSMSLCSVIWSMF